MVTMKLINDCDDKEKDDDDVEMGIIVVGIMVKASDTTTLQAPHHRPDIV